MLKFARKVRAWLFRDVTNALSKLRPHTPPATKAKSVNERDILARSAISALIPDMTVKNGPFSGMRFPTGRTSRHTYFPKIFGSYERETHEVIERICATPYDTIIDIGSADGYFAVGLAMRIPTATVHAFDPNTGAMNYLLQMAELNGVADRIQVGDFCDPAKLISLPKGNRALVFCDCEGYEKELFTTEVVEALKNHDVFVETHDLFDIEITPHLRNVFSDTHDLISITSIDDVQKAHLYNYQELSGFSLADKKLLLAERRQAAMEWFFFTPKTADA